MLKKMSKKDRDGLVKFFDDRNEARRPVTVEEAIRILKLTVSDRTVRRILVRNGLKALNPVRRLALSDKHIQKRLQWARDHQRKTEAYWRGVFCMDNRIFKCALSPEKMQEMRDRKKGKFFRRPSQGVHMALPGKKHRASGKIVEMHCTAVVGAGQVWIIPIGKKWNGKKAATMFRKIHSTLQKAGVNRRIQLYMDGDKRYWCPVAQEEAHQVRGHAQVSPEVAERQSV